MQKKFIQCRQCQLGTVYTAKSIESAYGNIHGIEHMELTKTVIVFIIYSVAGEYINVMSLNPVVKLNAELQYRYLLVALSAAKKAGFIFIFKIIIYSGLSVFMYIHVILLTLL